MYRRSCDLGMDGREQQMKCYETNKEIIRGFRFVCVLDNFVCPECWPLDGMKFCGEAMDKRPKAKRHDGCRCIYLPVLPTFKEMGLDIPEFDEEPRHWCIRNPQNRKILESGKIQGTAEDWILTLPPDQQRPFFRSQLAYELWSSGRIKAIDLLDPKSWRLRTDDVLKYLFG